VNIFEKAFFFTQEIDDNNCSFSTLVFGQDNLSARLMELDVLVENTILTIFKVTTPEEYNWEFKCLLITSLYLIEPFLLWKKQSREISLIKVDRVNFSETTLRPNNFEG
jgi:hypothetical protein